MDNLSSSKTGNNNSVAAEAEPRRKPGPEKKASPRSEKLSCRLTKEEKALGEQFCKERGIPEAKLLRAAYLAAITQTREERFEKLVDALLQEPLDTTDISLAQKLAIKMKAKETLKKSAMMLLLILLGCAAAPTVTKYILQVYEAGKAIIYGPNDACIYHTGEIGCEMVPRK